jgi:hypothetical protein
MTTHAQLSPSKRHRWALCPGSVREEAKYPEERTNAAAIDGTHSHTLLEHCIKAGLANPLNMVGVKLKDDDGEYVAFCVEFIGGDEYDEEDEWNEEDDNYWP